MKTIYLMTRLAWKVFISSKPCRLIVILLQGFVQHMFDKLLFLLTPLKIAISYKVKKNSTKWNSRAKRGCRTATSSMRASAHPPESFLYNREVQRTFLLYKKSPVSKDTGAVSYMLYNPRQASSAPVPLLSVRSLLSYTRSVYLLSSAMSCGIT